jgi:gliding motility-associated-like protein
MRKNIFIVVLLIGHHVIVAQGFYNKGALVSLAPQTVFVVPDSLVNTGTLTNNGDIRISGAWINTGTYDAGTGLINFNSNVPQVINHNDQSVGRLTISGGGEKQFLANITIESELVLQDGILVSGNNAKIIFAAGSIVTGASNISYVRGPVEHHGTGNWLFPIGNNSSYLPVEISNVTLAAARATISLHELTAGQTLTGDVELARLSTKRYWQLALGGGNIDLSKIKLPLSAEEDVADNLNELVVAASDNATTSYRSLGQLASTGTLTSGSVTSERSPTFAFFTVAGLLQERGIEVYNGVSSNADGVNDFMHVRNIEFYPDSKVEIFNRWGDRVFVISGYDNNQKNFRGASSVTGDKLPAGTYFYSIDLKDGSKRITGSLELK